MGCPKCGEELQVTDLYQECLPCGSRYGLPKPVLALTAPTLKDMAIARLVGRIHNDSGEVVIEMIVEFLDGKMITVKDQPDIESAIARAIELWKDCG